MINHNFTKALPVHRWRKIALSRRKHLPGASGLYAIVNVWGKVLYVGKSKNLNDRWNATGQRRHHRYWLATLQPWCRLRYFETRAHGRMEKFYIDLLKPPWNNSRTPWWACQDNALLGKIGAAGWLLSRLSRQKISWELIIAGTIAVILFF